MVEDEAVAVAAGLEEASAVVEASDLPLKAKKVDLAHRMDHKETMDRPETVDRSRGLRVEAVVKGAVDLAGRAAPVVAA